MGFQPIFYLKFDQNAICFYIRLEIWKIIYFIVDYDNWMSPLSQWRREDSVAEKRVYYKK